MENGTCSLSSIVRGGLLPRRLCCYHPDGYLIGPAPGALNREALAQLGSAC